MHTYDGKVQLKRGSVVNLVGARLGDAEAELWVVEEAGKTTLVSTRTSTLLVPASLRNDIFKSCQFWSSLKRTSKLVSFHSTQACLSSGSGSGWQMVRWVKHLAKSSYSIHHSPTPVTSFCFSSIDSELFAMMCWSLHRP